MTGIPEKKEKNWTYGDYCDWPDEERWELIDGVAYDMTAPTREHSLITGELFRQLANFFQGKPCEVHAAPFDVRFPVADEADDRINTVVQPDIVVVCDPKKLDDKGGRGAPDLVIEVLSPSTASKDCILKRALYEKRGVKEFWIVRPTDKTLDVFKLGPKGRFEASVTYDREMKLTSDLFPGLKVDLRAVFPALPKKVKESPRAYRSKKP